MWALRSGQERVGLMEGSTAAGWGSLAYTVLRAESAVGSWRSFLLTSAYSSGSWGDGAAFLGSEAGMLAVLSLVPAK